MRRFLALSFLTFCVLTQPANAQTATVGAKKGSVFKDCDTCPEMVVIPAGSFKMGDLSGEGDSDEKPVHEVEIGYSFAVGT